MGINSKTFNHFLPFNFQNKTVLITGGSRGIGAAVAELFARLGAHVAFNFQYNRRAAEKILTRIRNFSGDSFAQQCDVADYAQVDCFIKNIIKKFKHIDILVNNAGIW